MISEFPISVREFGRIMLTLDPFDIAYKFLSPISALCHQEKPEGGRVPGSPVHPPFPEAMVMGDPTRGIELPKILTSLTCGRLPPPRRIASGWASWVKAERSDWSGGRVFWRHIQGVPSEQNPQPPLRRLSLWVVGDRLLVKEDVKSISMGYDCGVGRRDVEDVGGLERFRFKCIGDVGDGSDCWESRIPRSLHRHDDDEHNPQSASGD
jgi:hypothetical protein